MAVHSNEIIINTIKKMLGIDEDYNAFDKELLFFINSAIMELSQLGVGSPDFQITEDGFETWSDFLNNSAANGLLNGAQEFIYIKTRLIFDPPNSGYVTSAFQKKLEELTWRLRVQIDGD